MHIDIKEIITRRLEPNDVEDVYLFFTSLSEKSKQLFHPHIFDKENAIRVCNDQIDYYYGLFYNKKMIGYSMLRGWREGHNIPSYGGCITDDYQNKKLGYLLLEWTINQAKQMKCNKIILKVYKTNYNAFYLYEKFGFRIFEVLDKEYRMELDL